MFAASGKPLLPYTLRLMTIALPTSFSASISSSRLRSTRE
jgi:hypothetical protein